MLTMIQSAAMRHNIPPDELPSSPDEIDLERVVDDPVYRSAVKDLLRAWGPMTDRGANDQGDSDS
jgi:hypothetical protein